MSGSSLTKVLSTGNEALFNSRVGIDTTGHNIANAHTEGYSRQVVQTQSKIPATYGRFVLGTGAEISTIKRSHDDFVERQMRDELQSNGRFHALSDGLHKLEDVFSPELTSTIRERADSFINSVRELSNFPEELPVRVALLDNAEQLSQSFNTAHSAVKEAQDNLTSEIRQHVAVANESLKEVARLNVEITAAESGSKNPGNDLLDRRDALVRELSEMMDIQAYKGRNGNLTLRGPGGELLVEDSHAAQMQLRIGEESGHVPMVYLSDLKGTGWKRVNGEFTQGKISGLVEARDVYAQRIRDQLNDLARDFSAGFNHIHRMGYGLSRYSESNGRDFFTGTEIAGSEPAARIQVSDTILREPSAIGAALTPASPGDNIVVNEMIRFFDTAAFGDKKVRFRSAYEEIIGHIGTDVQQAVDERDASDIVLAQIRENKESISGVSLDEEATNMMKYQNLFNASSKLITTADEMMQTVLSLK